MTDVIEECEGFLYEFVLLLVEFQLVYKRLGPDSSSVITGFVLVFLFWKSSSCSSGFEDGNNSSIPLSNTGVM